MTTAILKLIAYNTKCLTSEVVVALRTHGPGELLAEGLWENLLNLYFLALAPGDGDPRVHVVDL